LSRIRATVEHPFLVVKRLWGHGKVRYRGIKKNLAQMQTLFGFGQSVPGTAALDDGIGKVRPEFAKVEETVPRSDEIPHFRG
jgi:hypothetical protein